MKKLKEAVANNVPMMENRLAQVTDNVAGDQFEPVAYWKLLETTGEVIDEFIMNVEDGNFRAPTMPEEEHNISFSGKPTKKIMMYILTALRLLKQFYSLK